MDDVQHRLARELAEAVSVAVSQSADVGRCHQRARIAGFHVRVTLEATVGFAALAGHEPVAVDADAPAGTMELTEFEVSANDRRFLRSLRIAAEQVKVDEAS